MRVSTGAGTNDIAEVLQLPHQDACGSRAYLGGGFGNKEDVTVGDLLVCWSGRPAARAGCLRAKSRSQSRKRHPPVMRYRTGAARRRSSRSRWRSRLRRHAALAGDALAW
jgi:hypothetical protein